MSNNFKVNGDIYLKVNNANLTAQVNKIKTAFSAAGLASALKFDIDTSGLDKIPAKFDAIDRRVQSLKVMSLGLGNDFRDISKGFNVLDKAMDKSAANATKGGQRIGESVHDGISQGVDKSQKKIVGLVDSFVGGVQVRFNQFLKFAVAAFIVDQAREAFNIGFEAVIKIDEAQNKLRQLSGETKTSIRELGQEVAHLGKSLGVSTVQLSQVSETLSQAGFSIGKIKGLIKTLALTELAPTFEGLEQTTDGLIAVAEQFKLINKETNDTRGLEKYLDTINKLSKKYAVEAGDLSTGVKLAGAPFATSYGIKDASNIGENLDQFRKLAALTTLLRDQTRLSAAQIGTGLKTLSIKLQSEKVQEEIEAIFKGSVKLRDVEGNFIGVFEAFSKINEALAGMGARGETTNQIFSRLSTVLGGERQGKFTPILLSQMASAWEMLSEARQSDNSVARDAEMANERLSIKISKIKHEIISAAVAIAETSGFKGFIDDILATTKAAIKLMEALKPLVPLIATLGIAKAVIPFAMKSPIVTSFSSVGAGLGRFVTNKPPSPVMYNKGGMIPGYGTEDTIPAMLTKGEYVIKAPSVRKYGRGLLDQINNGNMPGFNDGGMVDDETQIRAALKKLGISIKTYGREDRNAHARGYVSMPKSGGKPSIVNVRMDQKGAKFAEIVGHEIAHTLGVDKMKGIVSPEVERQVLAQITAGQRKQADILMRRQLIEKSTGDSTSYDADLAGKDYNRYLRGSQKEKNQMLDDFIRQNPQTFNQNKQREVIPTLMGNLSKQNPKALIAMLEAQDPQYPAGRSNNRRRAAGVVKQNMAGAIRSEYGDIPGLMGSDRRAITELSKKELGAVRSMFINEMKKDNSMGPSKLGAYNASSGYRQDQMLADWFKQTNPLDKITAQENAKRDKDYRRRNPQSEFQGNHKTLTRNDVISAYLHTPQREPMMSRIANSSIGSRFGNMFGGFSAFGNPSNAPPAPGGSLPDPFAAMRKGMTDKREAEAAKYAKELKDYEKNSKRELAARNANSFSSIGTAGLIASSMMVGSENKGVAKTGRYAASGSMGMIMGGQLGSAAGPWGAVGGAVIGAGTGLAINYSSEEYNDFVGKKRTEINDIKSRRAKKKEIDQKAGLGLDTDAEMKAVKETVKLETEINNKYGMLEAAGEAAGILGRGAISDTKDFLSAPISFVGKKAGKGLESASDLFSGDFTKALVGRDAFKEVEEIKGKRDKESKQKAVLENLLVNVNENSAGYKNNLLKSIESNPSTDQNQIVDDIKKSRDFRLLAIEQGYATLDTAQAEVFKSIAATNIDGILDGTFDVVNSLRNIGGPDAEEAINNLVTEVRTASKLKSQQDLLDSLNSVKEAQAVMINNYIKDTGNILDRLNTSLDSNNLSQVAAGMSNISNRDQMLALKDLSGPNVFSGGLGERYSTIQSAEKLRRNFLTDYGNQSKFGGSPDTNISRVIDRYLPEGFDSLDLRSQIESIMIKNAEDPSAVQDVSAAEIDKIFEDFIQENMQPIEAFVQARGNILGVISKNINAYAENRGANAGFNLAKFDNSVDIGDRVRELNNDRSQDTGGGARLALQKRVGNFTGLGIDNIDSLSKDLPGYQNEFSNLQKQAESGTITQQGADRMKELSVSINLANKAIDMFASDTTVVSAIFGEIQRDLSVRRNSQNAYVDSILSGKDNNKIMQEEMTALQWLQDGKFDFSKANDYQKERLRGGRDRLAQIDPEAAERINKDIMAAEQKSFGNRIMNIPYMGQMSTAELAKDVLVRPGQQAALDEANKERNKAIEQQQKRLDPARQDIDKNIMDALKAMNELDLQPFLDGATSIKESADLLNNAKITIGDVKVQVSMSNQKELVAEIDTLVASKVKAGLDQLAGKNGWNPT